MTIANERLRATTGRFCTCWIVRREDGVVLGFTNHDRTLKIEGVECVAASGFEPAEASEALGLGVDAQDVAGVLDDAAITRADIRTGRFDGAMVEVWTVDWSDVSHREHRRTAVLGEIRQEDGAFRAELRGLTHRLDRACVRRLTRRCDATLGDGRCGVDLSAAHLRTTGAVRATGAEMVCSGLDGFGDGWFTQGSLVWTSGANKGARVEVSHHAGDRLAFWEEPGEPVAEGDAFEVVAGCDKLFGTCRDRFKNAAAFRGFPHMPGDDFALSYVNGQTVHDGTALIE